MNEKSLIPSLRFAGFTDAWERRKVKCVAPLQRGFDLPKAQMETGAYPVVMSNGVNGYHVDYIVKGPGVITGRSGTIGRLHYIESNFWPHNTTLWVTNFYGNIPLFIYYIYQNIGLENYKSGSGVPTLNRNDIHDITVTIPDKKEQQSISSFFKLIDDLITLHQRKHEKLLHIKKSMLDKMFPKDGELFPEVRFAGFSAAWERRRLGDFVESLPSKKYITAPTPDGKIEIIQQGNVPIIGYANGIPCDDYENITVFGDHTVSIYKPHKPFFLATDGTKLLSARSLDGDFFYFLLERYKPIPEGYKRHYTILIERYGCFPCKREQKQIAILLKHIDTLITLHQRKLEKLRNIKKACLEKMFV